MSELRSVLDFRGLANRKVKHLTKVKQLNTSKYVNYHQL